jgi:2,3-bisphosphoglycerate-dependent phosphoglycerate mutase
LPTRLILVRHGQTVHNIAGRIAGSTDSPLSDLGREQAASVAEHVAANYALDALYASPLQRALHTALAIGERAGHAPRLRDDLRELNFGDLENSSESEIAQALPEAWLASRNLEDLSFAWPNGERRGDFFVRVRRALAEIVAEHPGQTVGVVAHGAVIGSFLAEIAEGRPWLWTRYLMFNCALSEVEAAADRLTLLRYNEFSFLPPSAPDPLILALSRD